MKRERIRFERVTVEDYEMGGLLDATFHIMEGEIVAAAGQNNSGLRTLFRVLRGERPGYGGKIFVDGAERVLNSVYSALDSGIELIDGEPKTYDNMSVRDNLCLGIEKKHMLRRIGIHKLSEAAAALSGEMGVDLRCKSLKALDDFEKKKIEIIRSVSRGVKLLAFEDIHLYCDERQLAELSAILKRLSSLGISILLQHNENSQWLTQQAGRCIVIRKGRVSNTVYKRADGVLDISEINHISIGRHFEERKTQKPVSGSGAEGASRLVVKNGGRIVLEAGAGEIIGIYDGGRLSALREPEIIAGELCKRFEITIDGEPLRISCVKDLVRTHIAVITNSPSDEQVIENLSPAENVCHLALTEFGKTLIFDRSTADYLFELITGRYNVLKHCRKLAGRTDCRGLSCEEKYEIMLARWLAINPKVVLLFGPLANDDLKNQERTRELLKHLAQQGKIIGIVSSSGGYFSDECERIYRLG